MPRRTARRHLGRRDRRCDHGQAALVLVVAVAVILAAMVAGLGGLAADTTAKGRAQSAADAAALASLTGGQPAAVRLADANGAVVVSWRRGPGADEVTVVVHVDGVRATARATNAP